MGTVLSILWELISWIFGVKAPTEWETKVIEKIDKLLKRCQLREIAFEEQKRRITEIQSKELVAQRLRYFAIDLYSVLDYLCYLSYCHFKSKGSPIDDAKARMVTFPYASNLRIAENQQDEEAFKSQRDEFLKTRLKNLGLPDDITSEYGKLIMRCQIITKVGEDGTTPVPEQPESSIDAKNFRVLYWLRNYTLHRDLVAAVVAQKAYLCYNKQDKSLNIEPGIKTEDELNSDQNSYPINQEYHDSDIWEVFESNDPSYWIEIPPMGESYQRFEPLVRIAGLLLDFVIKMRNKWLKLVFTNKFPEFAKSTRNVRCENGNVHVGTTQFSLNEFDAIMTLTNTFDLFFV